MHGAYRRTFGPESLAELSKNMIIQHEDYLKQDDADKKADALRYMAGYATQYLHLVPQEKKFTFKETERVLHNSAMNIAEFDPREGSLAFCNLAKYAENLLEQPWRKDFHVIKLTSGFYVHNVAAQLQNAHEILIVMGYVNIDDTTLKLLPAPLNYNKLKAVSRDCYIASQECLILSQIWQHVADQEPDYPLTIGEVFEYRKNHLGDTDTICNKLMYDIRQRMHLVKQQQQQQQLNLKYQQHQPSSSAVPSLKTSQQRFVPVERLIDYGVDDVGIDEPDLLPTRAFAPERETERTQDLMKNLNLQTYRDEDHIYDPVYGSNEYFTSTNSYQQQLKTRHPSALSNNQNQHLQSNSRKSMPATSSNYNPYQHQQYHNNFNSNGSSNIMMMYGDARNERNQSLSPMIPKTVTSLFTNNVSPNNGIHSTPSVTRNNVSKSNSMNSISRAVGAASSSSSSSGISQNFPPQPLTRTKIKETDLDSDLMIMSPPRERGLMQYHDNAIGDGSRSVRARKSMPASMFQGSQPYQALNTQVYPDEFYPPGIVKPTPVYGASSAVHPPAGAPVGSNFQYYPGRPRQNSDNSEDVLNEAYAYASEVNQMPKGTAGARVSTSSNQISSSSAQGQIYQHQATPIPQGSDSDSQSAELNNRGRGSNLAAPASTSARSGSSTDASSWEGSVQESDTRGRVQHQISNKLVSRKSEPAKRPNHIDIRRSDSSSKMRFADSSPDAEIGQQQTRNKNGYRELSSSSSGGSSGSPASSSSQSRYFQRTEQQLNSLDTVYYDYLLKQGQTDEVMGRGGVGDGNNVNSTEVEQDSREARKKGSRTTASQNNYAEHDENHLYDGRRVIPRKKQTNSSAESSSSRKRLNPVESVTPSSSKQDPGYNNNLITAEITKPTHEKNVKRSTNSNSVEQARERTPVENEIPPSPPKKPVEPWDCRFCTFRNTVEERICEMCAKSKDFFEDADPLPPISNPTPQTNTPKLYSVPQPSTSGGSGNAGGSGAGAVVVESQEEVECPQCTLLNPIRARVCDACNFRLKPVESPKTLEENPYDLR